MTKNAYYFSHDANARNDPKIKALRRKYGLAGYAKYFIIIEMLREAEDYELPTEQFVYDCLADEFNESSTDVEQMLNDLSTTFKLLENDGSKFWSESLKNRMSFMDKRKEQASLAGKASAKKRVIDKEISTVVEHQLNVSATSVEQIKEKKVKENKKNNNTCIKKDEAPYQEIMDMYNSICETMPKIKGLSDKRKHTINARWKEHEELSFFEELFKMAEQSDFLSGRSGKWEANFDWLMKESNCIKVVEGNYKNKGGYNEIVTERL